MALDIFADRLLRRDDAQDQAREDPGELALFERAAQLYRGLGDPGGEAKALFWIGASTRLSGTMTPRRFLCLSSRWNCQRGRATR